MKRVKTKHTGVYMRTSETRRYKGKPDACYDITYKLNNRKVWEKVGWKSEGVTAQYANQKRAEKVAKIKNRPIPHANTQNPTLGQVWEKYKELHLPTLVKPEGEVGRYDRHLVQWADRRLDRITAIDLEKLKQDKVKEGLQPATIRHILGQLRAIINKAIDWDLFPGPNPVRRIKMPQIDNKRERYLTPEEAAALLDLLYNRSLRTWRLSLLSLHTGMRFSELARLTWQSVNLVDRSLTFKGKRGWRNVHMTPTAAQTLADMEPGAPGSLVFPSKIGGVSTKISTAFARAVDSLGLNDGVTDDRHKVVFHTLRHTCASWLAIQGVSMLKIADRLGHSQLEMVRRYSHLSPEARGEASDIIERVSQHQ